MEDFSEKTRAKMLLQCNAIIYIFGFLAGIGFPLYGITGFINHRIIMPGRVAV